MKKNRTLFIVDHCLTPYERINTAGILCDKGKIIATGSASAFSRNEDGLEVIELENAYAVPGFIDSHIHGICEQDTTDAAFDLETMSRLLAARGVTTFAPTLVSLPTEEMLQTVERLANAIDRGCSYADVCGIHLEGPFLNPEKRGSQTRENIRKYDRAFADELIKAGKGHIKLMTFAPELDGALELTQQLMENGIIPSMGHSNADAEKTLVCVDAGVTRCTYVFNGMPQLDHRNASLTTIALTDDRVSVEMIVDGIHVHPRMADLVYRCKPADKLIGISNAVVPQDKEIRKQFANTAPRIIRNTEGEITGTTLTLDHSWLQLTKFADIPREQAAACFSTNPAKDLGLITRGEIRPGRRADITIFDKETNDVRMTVSRGQIVYDSKDNTPS